MNHPLVCEACRADGLPEPALVTVITAAEHIFSMQKGHTFINEIGRNKFFEVPNSDVSTMLAERKALTNVVMVEGVFGSGSMQHTCAPFSFFPDHDLNKEDTSFISVVAYGVYIPLS